VIRFLFKGIVVILKIMNTSLFSISLLFLLYQTIHQIYYISHIFLSSHTLSYLFLSSHFLFTTKHTIKVFGIPLHVWGERLFKAIGGVYGEFLDIDNDTASKAKLDVACLKLATDFRGKIDETVRIRAMGVIYPLRVVEEKVLEYGNCHGERFEERENSWVDSVHRPLEAQKEDDGGLQGGGGKVDRRDDGGAVPEKQIQVHGNSTVSDGDVSGTIGGKGQNPPFMSVGMLGADFGKLVEKVSEGGEYQCR
jgi:hypothetical protein